MLNKESAKEARIESNKAKKPSDIPFFAFTLPDGQRLNYGVHPRCSSTKHRICGVWDYCRKSLIKKLKIAIKNNNEERQAQLVKCLNVVNNDLAACNFINGFNDELKLKTISFDEFKKEYKAKILELDTEEE